MGLEAATYISDFVATNPVVGDDVAQGDDHIRLLKAVLKATFPNADKAIYFPEIEAKTADFTVASTDKEKTFTVSTASGTVTATLPSLGVSDDGWQCHFIKTNTGTNPLFIAPASGTLQSGEVSGLAKCRRVIPGKRCTAIWTGGVWFVTRNCGIEIGGFMEGQWATAPVGFELPNGQTLSSASTNYPEFYAVNGSSGVTLDLTGRVTAMIEASATRLTSAGAGVDGATQGSAGGSQTVNISQENLPNISLTTTIAEGQGLHGHDFKVAGNNAANQNAVDGVTPLGQGAFYVNAALSTKLKAGSVVAETLPEMSGVTPLGGSGTAISKLPPIIVVRKVLVVE